jgi:hypothetical protein
MKLNLEKLKKIAGQLFLPLIVLVYLVPQDSVIRKPIEILSLPILVVVLVLALEDLRDTKKGKK